MLSLGNVKSKWPYIVILAIIAQFVLVDWTSDDKFDEEIESAIKRAKTESCKRELRDFARRIKQDTPLSSLQLRRTCKLDLNKQRLQRYGCVTNSTTALVLLDDMVANSSVCYELCFSFGHSHAGYAERSSQCFCGGKETNYNKVDQFDSCVGQDEFDWYRVDVGIFQPNRIIGLPSNIKREEKVRIAFLLIVRGRSDIHIIRLINSIYSPMHIYYIHVDRRDEYLHRKLSILTRGADNIILAPKRFETVWGGPSMLRMTIDAITYLTRFKWDYIINLSESDFPIKPLSAIEDYLRSTNGLIHLKMHNILGYNFIKKQGLNRNFYQCESRVWLMGKRQLPKGIVFSGGSDWFALPHGFCSHVVEQIASSDSNLIKPLLIIFNQTLLPVESFFHTIALNSHFCDKFHNSNLRVTNWNRKQGCKCQHREVVDWCGCSPQVYKISDWNKIKQIINTKNLFFTRKFNPTISSSVIEAVERYLITNQAEVDLGSLDTRYWESIYDHEFDIRSSINSETMHIFGQFSKNQLLKKSPGKLEANSSRLVSSHLHFEHDKFVGYVLQYCQALTCFQLLVKKLDDFKIKSSNNSCSDFQKKTLNIIDVNHGFDTGERAFLNYLPLNEKSDIVVYHEWLVSSRSLNETVDFIWRSSRSELVQNIRLKGTSKPSKLTLAHRLNRQGHLVSGLWNLVVSIHGRDCLSFRFLVLGKSMLDSIELNQQIFDRFYSVTGVCLVDTEGPSSISSCLSYRWSHSKIPHLAVTP